MNKDEKSFETVEKGYDELSDWYRGLRTTKQSEMFIFQQFLNQFSHKKILELGCASGFPIGETILKSDIDYLGVDLSQKQINLAKNQYPEHKTSFIKGNMIKFCETSEADHYSGVISMFTIRHIPRTLHAHLFNEIFRILSPNGLLLIDVTENPHDGTDSWNTRKEKMFWSGFSKEWTLQTLKDLNFTLLDSMYYEEVFDGELEKTLMLLLQKPE